MKGHIDAGTIQAFLDGELAPDLSLTVSGHVAQCDECAQALALADEENSVVFAALEREFDSLVPTQRLWSKISDSIEVEKDKAPFWQKAWGFVTIQLATPSLAMAATAVIVFGGFTAYRLSQPDLVEVNAPQVAINAPAEERETVVRPAIDPVIEVSDNRPMVQKAAFRRGRTAPKPAFVKTQATSNAAGEASNIAAYLPGEETYVKTIATMSDSVKNRKDVVMRPSEQVAFERDMAVVDHAIDQLRKELKRNPKNEAAKQVLYTSYQNKIDLLNSVSQRDELIASLK